MSVIGAVGKASFVLIPLAMSRNSSVYSCKNIYIGFAEWFVCVCILCVEYDLDKVLLLLFLGRCVSIKEFS